MKRIKDKRIYIIIGLIIVLVFSMVYYYTSGNNSFSKYKIDKSKKIIYPVYNKNEIVVPNINVKGKTIGPRFELRREFYKETNQKFHMYTMSSFIEAYNRTNEKAKY